MEDFSAEQRESIKRCVKLQPFEYYRLTKRTTLAILQELQEEIDSDEA
jgi:hypothetical protein